MSATIVQGGDLVKTVIVSTVAGVGVTAIFSVAVWGGARFADLNHDGRSLAAGVAAALGILALIATAAAVTIGIVVMAHK